jgi:hypothetical protein
VSTHTAVTFAGFFRQARSRYLTAAANLDGAPDHDLVLAQIVTGAKNGLEYDLAGQAQAIAYLHMLASVEHGPSDYFLALAREVRMEAVTDRPRPKLAAVEAAIENVAQTEWILDEINDLQTAG